MQTLKEQLQDPMDEVDEVVSLYGGDTRAAIRALLEDCHHFHGQLVLANLATSRGFTRGWLPEPDRPTTSQQQSQQPQG